MYGPPKLEKQTIANMGSKQSTSVKSSETYLRTLKTARQGPCHCAESILRHHPLPVEPGSSSVRILDTHNQQPVIPPGDILIHAGDLTDNGSFDEIQAGLDWLAAHPHAHKIFIAGNHDVLLDEDFLARYPERRYGSPKTPHDLVWPDNVVYLNNSSTTVEISTPTIDHDDDLDKHLKISPKALNPSPTPTRTLKVQGSPYTPQYVPSAFQYPRTNVTFWDNNIPTDADIVITHGPPRLHLDMYSGIHRGCVLLGEEIARVKPRLHVFGHIHAGYGKEEVVFDSARRKYEAIINSGYNDGGWWGSSWAWSLGMMALSAMWCWVKIVGLGRERVEMTAKSTTMVNASVVACNEEKQENEVRNQAIVVEI